MRTYPATPACVAAGFTLLELMVVLVLIGIIFTFAMLSFGGDDIAEMMEEEMHRLETLIMLAADESVIRGQELAIRFTGEGYEFMVLQTSGWEIPQDDRLLRAHSLPPGVQLRLQLEDDAPVFPDQLSDENAVTPQVFLLSSGEVTPFVVVFESRQSTAQYHLNVSLMGNITTERAETF
ncbi:MAG: type II secretion system minor pseudopilin GspH [Gammaproteobacteria bacterium]